MITAEALFNAIGSADDILLLRSERPRGRDQRRWLPAAAAACLLVVLAASYFSQTARTEPVPPAGAPAQVLRLSGSDVGALHLLETMRQEAPDVGPIPDFLLYISPERYTGREQDGAYVILPNASSEGLPVPCTLKITHQPDISPEEAAGEVSDTLRTSLDNVSSEVPSARPEGLFLHADDGSAWDAEQVDVYIVGDGQGGVFTLTARYFTEAAEGHGARFSDMIQTFEVLPADPAGIPIWLTDLRGTALRLIPAVFSDRLSDVKTDLADGAVIGTYGADVRSDVSVSAIDYTVDSDRSPTSAVVSVKHRLGPEDSYSHLTLELRLEQGGWRAVWGGLEK